MFGISFSDSAPRLSVRNCSGHVILIGLNGLFVPHMKKAMEESCITPFK